MLMAQARRSARGSQVGTIILYPCAGRAIACL